MSLQTIMYTNISLHLTQSSDTDAFRLFKNKNLINFILTLLILDPHVFFS